MRRLKLYLDPIEEVTRDIDRPMYESAFYTTPTNEIYSSVRYPVHIGGESSARRGLSSATHRNARRSSLPTA